MGMLNLMAAEKTPAAEEQLPPHPAVGQRLVPADVDWQHPVYQTTFADPALLQDWRLEGGKRLSIANGKLVLESEPGGAKSAASDNHLVCWLIKEMPADFLLEFSVRPQNRKQGLNIVFFSARGIHGENIFDPSIRPRNGLFQQYLYGDINSYHISYWAAGRGAANVRKNIGFHLVATGKDLVTGGPADAFQTIRLYKRGGMIRLMVDDIVAVAFDDDGQTRGPAWNHSGWIGLRQMAHSVRCEYDQLKVCPLTGAGTLSADKSAATPQHQPPRAHVPARQPIFGQPCVFNPLETGMVIEDIWPSIFCGAARVAEMKRKIATLPWARAAYARMLAEAETVLAERPVFSRATGLPGGDGRCGMFTDEGHYVAFDPVQHERAWDPGKKEFGTVSGGWITLQHERLRRLISSLGFLWQLSGDRRHADWAWEGLRDLAALYEETAAALDVNKEKYRYVYGGLYEAQCQLQVVQALELLADAPGHAADATRVREHVITPGCESIARWMGVMDPFNMTVWGMAALTEAGRALNRGDWTEQALRSPRAGLVKLLEKGVRRHTATGKPDGLWFEHSPFYGCFYVITAILPIARAGEAAGLMNADLRERFQAMFAAPPHLADSELRLISMADRVVPGGLRLTQMIPLYEYAAGQVDPRHGALLALLYQRSGAPRNSLTALAWGPDELPAPAAPPALLKSCVLPEAGLATFRAGTPSGPATLWFANHRRYPGGYQGHHHMDKLAISLHAYGDILTSDLGCTGGELKETERLAYHSGTLAHNTLMLDECDQGAVETVAFDAVLDAPIPWARGAFRGNSKDAIWKTFRDHHQGRLQAGLYDDALISRTVWFDFPYVVLLDELEAKRSKRFGFIFHARGDMVVSWIPADHAALALPPLPGEGSWRFFTGRTAADPASCFVADWRPRADILLRSVTVSDGPFDAHWGATPDSPAEIRRGTIILRAPGERRRFITVLEVHPGSPTVRAVELQGDGARVKLYSDVKKKYTRQGEKQ